MEFYDINKFPAKEGLVLFPISMGKLSNKSQNQKTYLNYITFLNKKIPKSTSPKAKVSGIFIYTESLYFNSDKKSKDLKSRFLPLINNHKTGFIRLISKHQSFIQDAFSYLSWTQLYLQYEGDFGTNLSKLKQIYKKDELFQKYLKEDFKSMKKKGMLLDENQLNFFLEEHLMAYLLPKGKIQLPNNFINNHEKWILVAYPGKPLKAHIYLHQKNFFKLDNPKNKYQDSWYDLEEKKVYDFKRINLEEF